MNNNILTKIVIASLCCFTMLAAKTHIDDLVDPSILEKRALEAQLLEAQASEAHKEPAKSPRVEKKQVRELKKEKLFGGQKPEDKMNYYQSLKPGVEMNTVIFDDITVTRGTYSLTVGGGTYDSEITWAIAGTDAAGAAGTFTVDLEDGTYTFFGYDSYGDGWNGASANMTDEAGNSVIGGFTFTSGPEGSLDFSLPYEAPAACAEGESAITLIVGGGAWDGEITWDLSDGSSGIAGTFDLCLADGDYTFNGYDSYGDGWNGASAIFYDADGNLIASVGSNFVSGDTFTETVTIGGAPLVGGCTNPDAPNFNPDAQVDDGTCQDYCAGNTDTGSCGYWLATGLYTCDNLIGYGYDCTACEAEGLCTATGCNATQFDCGDGQCIPAGYYCDGSIENGNAGWGPDCSNGADEILGECCANDLYDAATCGTTVDCDADWAGCLSSLADYDAINGTNWYEDCSGCADTCAQNPDVPNLTDACYAAAYNIGSGACSDPCEGGGTGGGTGGGDDVCYGLVVAMFDAYGDGWNGNVLTIGDQTFELDPNTDGGSSDTACYQNAAGDGYDNDVLVSCDGGSWQSEVSWALYDYTGTALLSGGAPYQGCLGNCDSVVFGCTDMDACNYNPDATDDDGSCYGPDCTGECDGSAVVDACGECNGDGSACAGCAVPAYYADSYCDSSNNTAECNYDGGDCCPGDCQDPGANDPNDFYDCATNGGDCLDCADPNSDDNAEGGQCYDSTPGCTDSAADNFNPDATTDDGSCLYNGCAYGSTLGCSEQDIADSDCAPDAYVGDGYCDGFSEAYGVNLCCYDLDGGDCTEAECSAPPAWDASVTGLAAEGVDFDYFGYLYPAVQWDWDDLSDGEEPPATCEDQGLVTCSDGSCAATADDCPVDPYADCTGNVSWIGDGYCDGGNNNAECGFDAGDCCPTSCADDVANGCPDNPNGCYTTISCGDCNTCADPDDADLAEGGACDDFVQWTDAECAATFAVTGSADLDGDGVADDCYTDGSAYFSFTWEGGCTVTAMIDWETGETEDLTAYGFTNGFFYYGFDLSQTLDFVVFFGDVAASSGAVTADCSEAPACTDEQFDCGDGQCIPLSYVCDGSTEFCNAGWPADCANGADEGLDVCDYEDECDAAGDDGGGDGGDDTGCVNDDSTTDAYGDTCTSWYDANESPGSYGCTGGYDTDTFSAATQCCACQGDAGRSNDQANVNAISVNDAVNYKVHGNRLATYKKTSVVMPKVSSPSLMLNIETGEMTYSDNAASNASRDVSYIVSISCDACVSGGPWSGTFEAATSDILIWGFDDGSTACANVVGVSTELGNTAASDDVCATAGVEGCSDSEFDCYGDGSECIPASYFCDGSTEFCNAGWPADCSNGADEGLDVCGYEDECEPACAPGDVNNDGEIDVLDIVASVNYILEGGDDFATDCADLTGDGIVNVLDIVATVNIILGNRSVDAASASLIKTGDALNLKADGFIGGVQMTLSHGSDFSIELTDRAMVADYRTNGNETTLIIVAPESDELFIADGEYDIVDMIVANSAGQMDVIQPRSFELSEAYPNPFNPSTSINLSIPEAGHVSVMVYNVMGQLVGTLVDGQMDASDYSFTWDASASPSGVYLITATTANHTSTQKVMLLK